MSATICWRPTDIKDHYLERCGAPSSFIDAMAQTFDGFPVELSVAAIPRLQAMAAVFGGADESNPYLELIEVLENHKSVKLWAEY